MLRRKSMEIGGSRTTVSDRVTKKASLERWLLNEYPSDRSSYMDNWSIPGSLTANTNIMNGLEGQVDWTKWIGKW